MSPNLMKLHSLLHFPDLSNTWKFQIVIIYTLRNVTVLKFVHFCILLGFMSLTLSWWRLLSYRNQSIDLLWKSMDWFLHDNDLCHERVNSFQKLKIKTLITFKPFKVFSWNFKWFFHIWPWWKYDVKLYNTYCN